MKKTLIIALAVVLVAVPFAGCVENMSDLRDRVQGAAAEDPQPNVVDDDNKQPATNNTPPPPMPPVARIGVFGTDGMRLYQADFEAANVTAPIVWDAGEFTFVAGESEALENGATVDTFEWDIMGQAFEGRTVTLEITEPGVHMITLTVTDSLGSKDEQFVHLGIRPEPFQVSETVSGGNLAGAAGEGLPEGVPASESATFTVAEEIDGVPVRVQQIRVTLEVEDTGDAALMLANPDGDTVTRNNGGFGAAESLVLEPGVAGEWTLTASMDMGFTQAWTATIDVTYVEVIDGLDGGDGHDGHAHQH